MSRPIGPTTLLRAVTITEKWIEHAACRGMDPALFYPVRGESTREAKATCAACPVQTECFEYALAHGEKFGMWGGTSEQKRRQIRNDRRRAARDS